MDITVNDDYVIKRFKLCFYDIGAMNYVTCVFIILIHTMNYLMRILALYCYMNNRLHNVYQYDKSLVVYRIQSTVFCISYIFLQL